MANLAYAAATEHGSTKSLVAARSYAQATVGQHQQPLSLMLALYYAGVNTIPLLPKKTLTHIQIVTVEENPILNGLKLKPSPSITIELDKP